MLKLLGMVLVLFSCTALGWNKGMVYSKRLSQLREIEKMVYLILGEISYRKEALPEALLRTAPKVRQPFRGFLTEVSKQASSFGGERFSSIFREKTQEHLKGGALTKNDLEEFSQLGEYLGCMDITMQKNTTALYLEQLKREIQILSGEIPARKKLCQSLGIMGGIFLSILLL